MKHFRYFYAQLGNRLPLMIAISVVVGIMDGLGLAMFIPLLDLAAGGEMATADSLGKFGFLLDILSVLGVQPVLTYILLLMLFFFSVKGIAKLVEEYLNILNRQRLKLQIRESSIQALARLKYVSFAQADAGAIQNFLSGEIERISNAFTFFSMTIRLTFLSLGYLILALIANPGFTVFMVLGGMAAHYKFKAVYRRTEAISKSLVGLNNHFQGLLIQQVSFFKYLKATGSIKSYARNLISVVVRIEAGVRTSGLLNALLVGIREPLMMFLLVGSILIQVHFFGQTLSSIILSLLFFYRVLGSAMNLQAYYNKFLAHTGSLRSMVDFQTFLLENQERPPGKAVGKMESGIFLKNVSFAYIKEPVISNVTLDINKNETIALIGESGSGKTSLANLITGLVNPSEGEIFLDGAPFRELNMEAYQNRIGYITQEPVIFDDTVFNNVTFWETKNTKTLERFFQALQVAQIASFVDGLPLKEDSPLGNNGVNLSGGQKQRISIARELYKDIDLLIMDEATSALDAETERAIQDSIDSLKGKYTIIIIAHRFSTIKQADRIVLLRAGKIEMVGRFEELRAHSPTFNRMLELQNG